MRACVNDIKTGQKIHLYEMQYHVSARIVAMTKTIFGGTRYETGGEAEIPKLIFR